MSQSSPLVRSLHSAEGKGTLGCLIFLAMLGAALFIAIKIGPDYYAFKSFEADVKTEASRAGANFFDDETVMRNILDLARKNEIRLKREEIKIERFAGRVFIKIRYTLPADLIVFQRNLNFDISASSFIGRL